MRSAGLEPVHAGTHNLLGALGWWVQGRLLGKKEIAAADVGGMELLMPVIRAEARLGLRSRFALSVLAVGRKP